MARPHTPRFGISDATGYWASASSGGGQTPASSSATVDVNSISNALTDFEISAESAQVLGEEFTHRLRDVVCARVHQLSGLRISFGGEALIEPNLESARANLPGLMSAVRNNNLMATIAKRGSAAEAVVLLDSRVLQLLLELADKAIGMEEQFSDLAPAAIDEQSAAAIGALDIHRPLPQRQSVAERRKIKDLLASSPE